MIRLRPSGVDEVLIKRVRDWYEPGPGVFIQSLTASFSPAMLFTTGVTGAWCDPSDFTTLYQDAAGTTPVTAVEQPVGRMLDKSGRGNHAFNSSGNSANFPVLSARYNLLTKTEQFDDAVWTKSNVTAVNTTETTDPLGGNTADKLTCTSNGTTAHIRQDVLNVTGYTYSFYAKAGTSNFACFTTNTNATYANFNLLTGVVSSSASCTASITLIGNGWYRCTITNAQPGIYFMILGKDADPTIQPYGNGAWTSGNYIYIWGADLRVANDALNQPAYQRVNIPTDYDTVGFKPYLRFNGTNQWLQTNSIDFSYGDKMFVCAGVRHLSNANYGGLVGLGATVGTAGSFLLWTRSAAGTGGFEWYSNGNATGTITESATPTLPRTSVVSTTGDISLTGAANELKLRINGSLATTTAAGDCGTGNYANAVITIGSYNASNFFNGRLHQLVVAGKQASASEIGQTEAFTNQKTGAY